MSNSFSTTRAFGQFIGQSDTWFLCLAAIAARIVGLNLGGINPDRITYRKQPIDTHLAKVIAGAATPGVVDASPAILVTPTPERKVLPQYIGLRHVEYGCRVTFFWGNKFDPTINLQTQLYWRRTVSDEFDQKKLVEVPEVELCNVVPGDIFSLQHFAVGYDVMSLDVRCTACHRS